MIKAGIIAVALAGVMSGTVFEGDLPGHSTAVGFEGPPVPGLSAEGIHWYLEGQLWDCGNIGAIMDGCLNFFYSF